MKCKGCGMLLADDAAVCELCGTPTGSSTEREANITKQKTVQNNAVETQDTVKINAFEERTNIELNPFESSFESKNIEDKPKKATYDPFAMDYAPTKEEIKRQAGMSAGGGREKRKDNTQMLIIATVALVIAVVVIAVSIVFIARESRGDAPASVKVVEQQVVEEVVKSDTVTPMINNFINSYVGHNDMSVAIIDNKTREHYQSQYADSTFTAWGLYLPVYLAYGRYPGFDNNIREGIVSSDAGTSNNKANDAMRDMGGLDSVNNLLAQNFGVRGTTYGRYFGASNANADNYTTANDAVIFLQSLSDANEYAKLSYNIGSFGITAPSGAAVYAHVGTENRNVRNDLNIFAIVKGENSDYCVTIMSRNKSGRYISQLLANIHAEMEKN